MRIIVTDSGTIWNHDNPYLEHFKKAVLVVCLSGKKVTDKYECFVSPYKCDGIEEHGYGTESKKYQAFESVGNDLWSELGYFEHLVFLCDNNPESLYPFHIIKARNELNMLHLCALTPWEFETAKVRNTYEMLLDDLKNLNSVLYWDSNSLLSKNSSEAYLPTLIDEAKKQYGELLPKIIRGIYDTRHTEQFYFDFASETYVPVKEGFSKIKVKKKKEVAKPIDFEIAPTASMEMGLLMIPSSPQKDKRTKDKVAALIPRIDGKKICNILREQRIALAEANSIPFESVECPSIGPCAGTCMKCDKEVQYLTEQLMEIPENQRIYPQFDPEWELLS